MKNKKALEEQRAADKRREVALNAKLAKLRAKEMAKIANIKK